VPLRSCLIVDDEPSIRGYVKAILEPEKYQAFEAENGVEALKMVEKLGEILDLVVSDVRMPGGDGISFVCAVRESFPKLPIVLISAYAEIEIQRHRSTAFEFVQKPFVPATLLKAIEDARKMMELRAKWESTRKN
jgi:DNA-binding NtrC family response regulator